MLGAVREVSRSGFDAFLLRPPPAAMDAETLGLIAGVKALAIATRQSSGSRRMAKALQGEGVAVGRAQARRLMPQAGVRGPRPQRWGPVTTESRQGYAIAPNLLARQFDVAQPKHVWVGAISYVWTAEGWLSVSTLLDLYARKVVGWAMSSRIDTALVQDTLRMALGRRQPAAGLLHHSDRGSQ